jgi:hypothetical protein
VQSRDFEKLLAGSVAARVKKREQAKKVKTDKREREMKREHHQRNADRKQRRTGKKSYASNTG